MPVFANREGRSQRALLGKQIFRRKGKRCFKKRRKWGVETCSWHWVSEIGFPRLFTSFFRDKNFIETRFREKQRPLVVLDWGCGNGKAIRGLAEEYEGKVRAYGYSKDSYEEWAGKQKAKFIHSTKEDLLRYLKDDSVDLIYSHLGLFHLFEKTLTKKTRNAIEYVTKLVPKLSNGGVLCFDVDITAGETIITALQAALKGKATVLRSGAEVYVTKNA